ncbi:hypothetical protein IV203_009128 [Nitzschia inconspicua]|uniref:Uncharacterized protein n=1 Tax=Nitzschia inconspicua TaxID=303405 RepID=A0A9K3PMM7_9STRA|nr:hypothetical protein IV203_011124 [Nitzschia inconspicua]KAG7353080.1 hypothetical protein IV203_009128 [Nitzschia inconspicua]
MKNRGISLLAIILRLTVLSVNGWYLQRRPHRVGRHHGAFESVKAVPSPDGGTKTGGVEEYRNAVTKILSNLMQKEKMEDGGTDNNPISKINFGAPKISSSTSLQTLAAALDFELSEKEWFVTGNVNPSYFSESFKFQDPDVKIDGIEEYCKGVYKLFNQDTSRAEVISTVVNEAASTPDKPVITCTWRLSGGVNIGFGLTIKPYIVYTDFVVDPKTSLIVMQEDRFDIPSWDILLSALFPFLIGKVTKAPAPPVPKRDLAMPKLQLEGQPLAPSSTDFKSMFKSFFPGQ